MQLSFIQWFTQLPFYWFFFSRSVVQVSSRARWWKALRRSRSSCSASRGARPSSSRLSSRLFPTTWTRRQLRTSHLRTNMYEFEDAPFLLSSYSSILATHFTSDSSRTRWCHIKRRRARLSSRRKARMVRQRAAASSSPRKLLRAVLLPRLKLPLPRQKLPRQKLPLPRQKRPRQLPRRAATRSHSRPRWMTHPRRFRCSRSCSSVSRSSTPRLRPQAARRPLTSACPSVRARPSVRVCSTRPSSATSWPPSRHPFYTFLFLYVIMPVDFEVY